MHAYRQGHIVEPLPLTISQQITLVGPRADEVLWADGQIGGWHLCTNAQSGCPLGSLAADLAPTIMSPRPNKLVTQHA
jgi:hypothetical protein